MEKKVYICGPMTGYREFNYPAFHTAAARIAAAGFSPLNPASHTDTGKPWQFYARLGVRMLLDADAVATLPDWQCSRGATLEVHIAQQLGIPVLPIEQLENLAT